MVSVRIVEIPSMNAAFSGPLTDGAQFERFNRWFSRYHASLRYELFPRDFMWYNERIGAREWFYALPCDWEDDQIDGFQVVDLPSGLFAVASCLDADLDGAADWLKTREELIAWVNASDRFERYEKRKRQARKISNVSHYLPGQADGSGYFH